MWFGFHSISLRWGKLFFIVAVLCLLGDRFWGFGNKFELVLGRFGKGNVVVLCVAFLFLWILSFFQAYKKYFNTNILFIIILIIIVIIIVMVVGRVLGGYLGCWRNCLFCFRCCCVGWCCMVFCCCRREFVVGSLYWYLGNLLWSCLHLCLCSY